jgi:hypothetical protein
MGGPENLRTKKEKMSAKKAIRRMARGLFGRERPVTNGHHNRQ